MLHRAVRVEEEIRAVAPDRNVVSPRVLPFTPRLEMTDLDRWDRLCRHDPIGAAMIQTAFRKLYALHFPDDAETRTP